MGRFFPRFSVQSQTSAWGWAGQLLGPRAGPGSAAVLGEPNQPPEPFPAPWDEQSPRLSPEPSPGTELCLS